MYTGLSLQSLLFPPPFYLNTLLSILTHLRTYCIIRLELTECLDPAEAVVFTINSRQAVNPQQLTQHH